MKTNLIAILSMLIMVSTLNSHAQIEYESPAMIATAIAHKVVGPVKDFPKLSKEELAEMDAREMTIIRNKDMAVKNYPFWSAPTTRDNGLQSDMGAADGMMSIVQNWEAQYSYSYPPDCNGTAGPDHYMQTVNVKYTIYDKQGNSVAGPTNLNSFFTGLPGGNYNDGDPIMMYDDQAQKYMLAEFSGISGPDYMLVAVSQTDDPTGLWDAWSFPMNGFPDYMKFGIWRDGYYMGTNTGNGNDIYAFERDVMIAGGSNPKMVQFNNPNRPNSGFHCVLPFDNDGDFAPVGTPGGFITINDNAWGGSSTDQLWIYELDVDWSNPGSSTFARVQQLDVEPFDSYFGPTWDNIYQPGPQRLDAVNQILMHRAQYRNFSGSEHIICNHTVDVDNTDHAGIRWYELEHDGTEWTIRQYGTYAPDGDSRWMGSIAMNGNHEIALGYSVSSNSTYPSIRFAGQSAGENAAASGILDIAEESIIEGAASQSGANRWGDYSNLAVDPDDFTFWYTTQYNINSSMKGTRVASFQFTTAPAADFEADNLYPETTDTVSFTDMSTGDPTSWAWTFTPNTVTYHNGTADTSQNPEVSFDVEGLYSVELTATNGVGPGTTTKTDYINAGGAIMLTITADPESICIGDAVQLHVDALGGNGSYTYSWTSNPFGFFSPLQSPVTSPTVGTTYSVSVSDGDQTVNGSIYVSVNPFPEITLGEWPDMLCNVGVPPVQLTATPEGGTYSGTGVTPEGLFYPETAEIGWNIITYTYQDTTSCESSAQDSIYVDDCVGVGENEIQVVEVKLYPNPSAGYITLESEKEIERIEIIDQTGKMVLMKKVDGKSTYLSSLRSKGLYYVRVYIENENALPTLVTKEMIIK